MKHFNPRATFDKALTETVDKIDLKDRRKHYLNIEKIMLKEEYVGPASIGVMKYIAEQLDIGGFGY